MKNNKLKFRYDPNSFSMVIDSRSDEQRPDLYDSEVVENIKDLVLETREALEVAKHKLNGETDEDIKLLEEEYETYLNCLSDCYFSLLNELPFTYLQ